MHSTKRAPLFTLALAAILTASALAATQFRVVRTIPVPGNGGWDYLNYDPFLHRLFIARGTRVQVLNTQSGKIAGEIRGTTGVHGVALAPAIDRGFTSNGKLNTVTVFQIQNLKVLGQTKVGLRPDAIVYDPGARRVFTMNEGSDDTTAIDPQTGSVLGTVKLGGRPEFAAADGRGRLFVNLEDRSEVAEVDTRRLKLLGRWSLAPGDAPSGMAIDVRAHRLYIGCHNRMLVAFDYVKHRVVGHVPIGAHVDACAFDPKRQLAFSSNGDGTLTVIGTHPLKVAQVLKTQRGARTMALDPYHHHLFLCTARAIPGRRHAWAPGSFVVIEVAP